MAKLQALPLWQKIVGGIVAFFVLLQIVGIPTLLSQTNPPVTVNVKWDKPETEALARRACFDCHSNETTWPIYSRIAPVSFLATKQVLEGRKYLNFSDWGQKPSKLDEEGKLAGEKSADEIQKNKMPTPGYLFIHPEANLTVQEKAALAEGLKVVFPQNPLTNPNPKTKGGEKPGTPAEGGEKPGTP